MVIWVMNNINRSKNFQYTYFKALRLVSPWFLGRAVAKSRNMEHSIPKLFPLYMHKYRLKVFMADMKECKTRFINSFLISISHDFHDFWYFIILDMDECKLGHDCEDYCNNTLGGYSCSCRKGYTLRNDNRTCTGIFNHN